MSRPAFEHTCIPLDAGGLLPHQENGFELWPVQGVEARCPRRPRRTPRDHGDSVLLGVVRVVRGVQRPIRQFAHRVAGELLADGEGLGPLGRSQP